jgi:Tfp pilus assembly protein PilX
MLVGGRTRTLVGRLRARRSAKAYVLVGLCAVLLYAAYLAVLTALRVYWGFDLVPYLADSTAAAAVVDLAVLVLVPAGCLAIGLRRRFGSPLRIAGSQQGFALIMAVGISAVLMIVGTTVAMYTASTMRSATDSRQRNLAFGAAESGASAAIAWLANNQSQWHAAAPVSAGPVSLGGGMTYSYTLTPNFPIWTVKSTGKAPNKAQGSTDTHTITRSVQVQASAPGINLTLWNMFFSDAPVGNCLHWNAIVEVPMYIRGDMCLDTNGDSDPITGWPPASLPGAAQLQVGGTIFITPSGHLGYGSNKLNIVQTGVGCNYNNGGLHNPCNANDKILANQYLTGTGSLAKPVIDLATWYKDSLPGPKNPCTSGSFPGGFDSDSTQNNSLGTVNLTPASAYDCVFTDGGGNVDGEVKWTPGSPGTLLVNGTVFWDGNLVVSSSFNYTGRATFYFGGTITLNTGVHVCGIANCTSSWNTNTDMLVLVAGSNNLSPSWAVNLNTSSVFQGAIEAGGDINQNGPGSTGSTVMGGLIAHQIYNLSPNDTWANFNLSAPGQPGGGTASESLAAVPGSFSG